MDTPIKIQEQLIKRLDDKYRQLSLGTRQNLTNTLIRKGLDFLDHYGYEKLLTIPNLGGSNAKRKLDTPGQES